MRQSTVRPVTTVSDTRASDGLPVLFLSYIVANKKATTERSIFYYITVEISIEFTFSFEYDLTAEKIYVSSHVARLHPYF